MGDSRIQSGNSQLAARQAAEAAARQAAEAAARQAAEAAARQAAEAAKQALQKAAAALKGQALVKDGFDAAPRAKGGVSLFGGASTSTPVSAVPLMNTPVVAQAGGVSQTAGIPATGPLTVEQATAEVKRLLSSNLIDDVTHDDLMAIEAILRRVPADQVNAVVTGLSDAELRQWVEDINDPGLAGGGPFRGLDSTERGRLFSFLADTLQGSQAGRFFTALDRPEQMSEFGEAFIQRGDVHDRLGFLISIGQTSFPDSERPASRWVIGLALDSLTSDPGRLAIAVRTLSEQNLQDGLLGAAGPQWNGMGPFGGQREYVNMDRLRRISDAVASTEDHQARAALFEGLAGFLRDEVRGPTPVQFMEDIADQVSGMMTGLISDDLASLVRHMSGEGGLDPHGTAFTTYAREQLRDGGGTLGSLLQQMRELGLQEPGANGKYDNAFLGGFFAGSVLRAVDQLTREDVMGVDATFLLDLTHFIVGYRMESGIAIMLEALLTEVERQTIDKAMNEGGVALRNTILDLLGIQLSPGNDNGTALGAFEQGLFAIYGEHLYRREPPAGS